MSRPETAEPALSGVVVHWHNEEQLAELLAAWPRDPRFELIVVDNGSSRPLPEGPARVLRPERNLGFGGGANAGIAATRAPVVLILNPDAVPEPGALDRLLEGFDAWPDAAGLAPRLTGPDGSPQTGWQLRRLPSPWKLLLQTLPIPEGKGNKAEPPAGTPVEQPAAAALALRREALAAVGGFDEGFQPAWFEDVDLAYRLREGGYVLRYQPAAGFRHGLGSTVPQLGYGPFLWIYYRNLVRYLGKHHGAGWALAARGLLVPGVVLRLLMLPFRRPRRAASRREAFRGLLGVLGPHPPGPPLPPPLAPSPGEGGEDGVALCIVTYNSAADLPGCFEAIAAVGHRPLEVVVVDCASRDDSLEVTRREATRLRDIPFQAIGLAENLGFAGGMNTAFSHTEAPWVMTLNADVRLGPDYVTHLLDCVQAHPQLQVGAMTGRLVRFGEPRLLDACGMRLTSNWRHLDRGSGEVDHGQWPAPERVFGGTGAATLFRRAALLDVAVDGEVFDPRFHSFREDAELAFRLRERGWEVLYEPAAVAEHRRWNLPERRSAMPAEVSYHSLKNRYLLRLYHQTGGNLLRTLIPTLVRDLAALGYVLLRERASLAAYAWLWRHRRDVLSRRRIIQGRRTRPPAEIDRWFRRQGEPL
ncbi:MAG TPA: glycosyltransferase [Thermoanaerobaculia bacterium]|nr:glycosyltransferase [Thermoanaerobaculia bacterium]